MLLDAIPKVDFERREQGLPPLKPLRVVVPEPSKPIVENEINLTDIPTGYEVQLEHAQKNNRRNEIGVMFIGFDVTIILNPIVKKRGPGRPKESEEVQTTEPKELKGWMTEGNFLGLVRMYRKQIDQQVIHW